MRGSIDFFGPNLIQYYHKLGYLSPKNLGIRPPCLTCLMLFIIKHCIPPFCLTVKKTVGFFIFSAFLCAACAVFVRADENSFANTSSNREIIVKVKKSSENVSFSPAEDPAGQKLSQRYGAHKMSFHRHKNAAHAAQSNQNDEFSKIYKIKLQDNQNIDQVLKELSSNPDIEYAEPNFTQKLLTVPNNQYFQLQWALQNTGQSVQSVYGNPGSDIKAENAWDICRGTQGVIIAVIDTGVDYTHPNLAKNMWVNSKETPGNGVDEDGNSYADDYRGWSFLDENDNVMDTNGHGTFCAGIIGAEANDGIGIAGVCWAPKIMALKIFTGNSDYTNDEICATAILYAVDNGAKIISASWGSHNESALLDDAVKYASDRGVVCIFAAGNDNSSQPYYPAANPLAISVGATDNRDRKASFSNYGDWVDVFAPGIGIYSTLPGNTYGTKSGTSMSCPYVAGVVGLMLSQNPNLSPADIKQIIRMASDQVSDNLVPRRVNAYQTLAYCKSNLSVSQAGGRVALPDGTCVVFPAGLTSDKLSIYISQPQMPNDEIQLATSKGAVNGTIYPIPGCNLIRSFTAFDSTTGKSVSNFSQYVRITIPYPDLNNNGYVNNTNIRANTLKLCFIDKKSNKWVIMENSVIDASQKTVTAEVSHFSTFGIFSVAPAMDNAEINAYPNPCRPAKDPIVTFGNIPLGMGDVKILIFNVAGELIKTLAEGNGIVTLGTEKAGKWDATNDHNEKVASGVYIYLVRSGGSKQKTGKIAILR